MALPTYRAARAPGSVPQACRAQSAIRELFQPNRAGSSPPLAIAIDRLRREASRDDRHAQAALLHARPVCLDEALA